MIVGAHVMVQSKDEEADRAFLTEVLKLPSVDAGGGFLIFGVPAGEIAIHESNKNSVHELYLMCENAEAFAAEMKDNDVPCTTPKDQGWGKVMQITLPGGGKLHVYEPRHARP